MNRRSFLDSLLGAPAVAKLPQAAIKPITAISNRDFRIPIALSRGGNPFKTSSTASYFSTQLNFELNRLR